MREKFVGQLGGNHLPDDCCCSWNSFFLCMQCLRICGICPPWNRQIVGFLFHYCLDRGRTVAHFLKTGYKTHHKDSLPFNVVLKFCCWIIAFHMLEELLNVGYNILQAKWIGTWCRDIVDDWKMVLKWQKFPSGDNTRFHNVALSLKAFKLRSWIRWDILRHLATTKCIRSFAWWSKKAKKKKFAVELTNSAWWCF